MAALHVCESHRRGIAKFTSQYVVKRNVPAGWAVITPTTATRSIMLATATTLNHMPSLTVWHRFTVATLSLYRRHLFTFWQIDLKRANEAWKKLKKKSWQTRRRNEAKRGKLAARGHDTMCISGCNDGVLVVIAVDLMLLLLSFCTCLLLHVKLPYLLHSMQWLVVVNFSTFCCCCCNCHYTSNYGDSVNCYELREHTRVHTTNVA